MGITGPAATGVAPHPASEENRTDQVLPPFASAPVEVALQLSVEIAQLLSADLTPALLMEQAAERIRERLGCACVGIYRSDAAGDTLRRLARAGDLAPELWLQATAEEDPLRQAVRQRKAILQTARTADTGEDDGAPATHLILPMTVAEKPLGALALSTSQARVLSQDTVPALQALAQHLAMVISNAESLEKEKQQRLSAERLNVAGRARSQTLDPVQTLGMVLGQLAAVVPHSRSSIMLEEDGELVTRAARGFPDETNALEIRVPIHDDDVYRTIGETRQPLLIPHIAQRRDWQYVEGLPRAGSWLGVPLILEGEVAGMLSLTRERSERYTEEEVTLSAAFANQAAMALHNANLFSNLADVNAVLEQAITELQKRSEELEITNQKLKHLDQAKSDFISIASHELRTPLTVLSGYSQMLMGDPEVTRDDDRRHLVKGILGGAERLTTIIDSMLDMARIDSRALQLDPEPIFLSVLIEAIVLDLGEVLTARNIAFDLDSSLNELPMIEVDPGGARKVFYHLIVNAVKYTPDGGSVRIWGRPLELEGMRPGRSWVEVVVSDTGIGVDPSVRELIFAKFYQTGEVISHSSGISKFKGGGTGLGLAITRGIIEAHGGRVWAESPGHDEVHYPGSDFHVILPLQPDTVLHDADT
ncbi:MAG: GAF domain-containing protein [Anaerolineae bacterium]|nr:GAF domain-containing protein [Anaerolineae bacterium]